MASTEIISPDKISLNSNNNNENINLYSNTKVTKPNPKPKLNIKIFNSNKSSSIDSSTMDTDISSELSSFKTPTPTKNSNICISPTNKPIITSNSPTTTNVNNSGVNTIDSAVNSILKNKNMKLDIDPGYVPSKKYSKKMKEANKILMPLNIKRTRDLQPSCTSATIPPKRHFFELHTSNLNVADSLSPKTNSNFSTPTNKENSKDKKKNLAKPFLVINSNMSISSDHEQKKSSIEEEYYGTSLAADLMQQQKQSKDSDCILTASEPYKYGPICILPYLYLGCEENAADKNILHDLNIGALLNVAYEVNNPFIMSFLKKDASSLIKKSKITDDEIDIEMIYDENADIEIEEKFSSEIDDEFDKEEEKRKFISKSEMSTVEAIRDLSTSLKRNIRYKKFYWHHNQDHLSKYFDKAFEFINESRNKKEAVLVSCQQGVSRSASLIIAYIMKTLQLNVAQAYAFVKLRNPHISPNLNLMNQLTEFEKILFQNSNTSNPTNPTKK